MSYNFYHNLAEIARNGGFVLLNENIDGSDVRIDWRFIGRYLFLRHTDYYHVDYICLLQRLLTLIAL